MNEEEIILYLTHTTEDDFDLEEHQKHNRYLAIQGLLDLYNKEKEKNKELTDEYMIQKHLINADFLKDYISKDKIRELQNKYKKEIEKLESKKIWNEPVDTINKNRYTNYFNAYEELLEERN